jgi:hypothetical protein
MNSLTTEQIDALPAGIDIDSLVAERVMAEHKPTETHDEVHLQPMTSTGGNWICSPEYDHGDKCEWVPLPFSTDINAAWRIVNVLEPWVCRLKSADGFFHLTCGHWADHGDCIVQTWTEAEERMEEDPRPWSFHIHLGLLAERGGGPAHWKHQDRFCALGPTAPLVICRAALKSLAGRGGAT